jgi:hypothetical protein
MVIRGGVLRADADRVDRLFQALADRTHRDILRLVLSTEQSVSALAARYPMSFAAVQKHVAVLELLSWSGNAARAENNWCGGTSRRWAPSTRLLDKYAAVWRNRIDQMDELLAESERGTEIDAVAAVGRSSPD